MKFIDDSLSDTRKVIEEALNPARKWLKEFDSPRRLAKEIEKNQHDAYRALGRIPDNVVNSMTAQAASTISSIDFGKLGGIQDSLVLAVAARNSAMDDAMKSPANEPSATLRRINRARLAAIDSSVLAQARMQYAFDGSQAGRVAERMIQDERDMVAALAGQSLALNIRDQWLDQMRPCVDALDRLVNVSRQIQVVDPSVFSLGVTLLGSFDDATCRILESARSTKERVSVYLASGADERIARIPHRILQRKARILKRATRSLIGPKRDRRHRELHKSHAFKAFQRSHADCYAGLLMLRNDIDRGMSNIYGSSWIDERQCISSGTCAKWKDAAHAVGIGSSDRKAYLECADETVLVELIEANWSQLYAYRTADRNEFLAAVRVLGQLQRHWARRPHAWTKFDELRLLFAARELTSALRIKSVLRTDGFE